MENLFKKPLEDILNPKPMNTLAQLWLSWHSIIFKHPPMNEILKLAEFSIIPKEHLYFKNKLAPFCISCAFGTVNKKPSRNNKGRSHTIRSKKDDALRKCVSMDQLISSQPGMIPKFDEHIRREKVWAASVAVDHFTNIIKVCLMETTSRANTLEAKLVTVKVFKDHGHNIENGILIMKDMLKLISNKESNILINQLSIVE